MLLLKKQDILKNFDIVYHVLNRVVNEFRKFYGFVILNETYGFNVNGFDKE